MPTKREEEISKLKDEYKQLIKELSAKEWEIQDRIAPLKAQIKALWAELDEYKFTNWDKRHEITDRIRKLERGGDL